MLESANKENIFNNVSLNLQQGNLYQTELLGECNVNFKQHCEMFQQIVLGQSP